MGLFPALLVTKVLRFLTRLRGGGSAFPGFILLRLVPQILERTLGSLPGGVIFVTGSNGKSTTTTMLASVLRAHGLRVFTNPAGGNLPQGLASAVVGAATLGGRVPADVAVLEVDEAYGPMTADLLRPNWVVVTNVQVDQLNRFGEPEKVFQLIKTLAVSASTGIVVNAGDPNLRQLGAELNDGHREVVSVEVSPHALQKQAHGLVSAEVFFEEARSLDVNPSVTLEDVTDRVAKVSMGETQLEVSLPAPGLHYAIDAAIAIGAAGAILGHTMEASAVSRSFHDQPPVYGRGEVIRYRTRDVALTMMKNLPSLQVNLSAMTGPLERVWIAVDEGTPDPSWIFDVDLGPLDHVDVISGTKAWQWVLLLEYRGIPYGRVIEDTAEALRFVAELPDAMNQPVHAIVNYEQMMAIRRLAGYKELEGAA